MVLRDADVAAVAEPRRVDGVRRQLELRALEHVCQPLRAVGIAHGIAQRLAAHYAVVLVEVRDESRVDNCAVVVRHLAVCGDERHVPVAAAEQRQERREQEEADASFQVEVDDLRHDAERRVVEHGAALGVLEALVVPAWVEGAHDGTWLDTVLRAGPVAHGSVHGLWREAVVRRALRLELVHELLVIAVRVVGHVAQLAEVHGLFVGCVTAEAELLEVERKLLQVELQCLGFPASAHGQLVVDVRVGPSLLV